MVAYKDLGMVSSVLGRYLETDRPGHIGIGHVRYSTHGANKLENTQPIVVTCNKGEISVAHNGNLSNMPSIKKRLFDEGSIFQTSSDTELLLHLLSRSRCATFHEALHETLHEVEGAYSMLFTHGDDLIAVRDPNGFRPLYVGFRDDLTVVASETCALDILRISDFREVEPGEILTIGWNGISSDYIRKPSRPTQCVFELIYFSRPDSEVFGKGVHERRKRMGASLARDDEASPPMGDIVVPIPDSGSSAALGYAEEAGLPFDYGLTRNHYAGRTFIMPTTDERELSVRMKLHPVRSVIAGKRVVLVDDSLVRGTTARSLVLLLKDAGAEEVHLRLSSPELRWPCFFGIDIPTRSELISNTLDPNAIAEHIGADSVRFLSISGLRNCLDHPERFCYACFSGEYPLAVPLTEQEQQPQPRDTRESGRNGRTHAVSTPENSGDADSLRGSVLAGGSHDPQLWPD